MIRIRRASLWVLIASSVIAPVVLAQRATEKPKAPQVAFAQTDPAIGTWKLNVAKSVYSPGPPPKNSTLIHEMAGEGVKITNKGIDAEGKPTGLQYTANLDGKDYPVTLTGSQDYDTVALRVVDRFTLQGTRKKAGTVVQTFTGVVSNDGKMLTVTTKSTNAKGQQINNVAVYEKQ